MWKQIKDWFTAHNDPIKWAVSVVVVIIVLVVCFSCTSVRGDGVSSYAVQQYGITNDIGDISGGEK